MYVIREMEDAVTDCTAGDSHFNLGQLVRHTHMLSRMPHVQRGPRARLGRSLGVLRRQPRGSDLLVLDTMIIRDTWSTWQSEGRRWQLGRQDALPVGWEEMQELWNVSDEHCRSQQTDLESLHQWQEEPRRRKVRIQWCNKMILLIWYESNSKVRRSSSYDQQDCQSDDRPTDPGGNTNTKYGRWKTVHQGTLRYAYKTSGGKGGPKDKAEGVAFLGAFLPRLHNCSAEVHIIFYDSFVNWRFLLLWHWLVLILFLQDADTVRRLMWIDGKMEADSFKVVRQLLERNYVCMGVTCSQVLQRLFWWEN